MWNLSGFAYVFRVVSVHILLLHFNKVLRCVQKNCILNSAIVWSILGSTNEKTVGGPRGVTDSDVEMFKQAQEKAQQVLSQVLLLWYEVVFVLEQHMLKY